MRRIITLLIVALIGLLATPLLLQKPSGNRPFLENLPWQIEIPGAGNSRVFGLAPGQSTLADAASRFGPDMDVAVMASTGKPGALEGYYDQFTAGVITGKLILGTDLDPAELERLRQDAVKSEIVSGTTRKFHLRATDLPTAMQAAIVIITFIPSANLDQEIALQRFGEPAQRIQAGAGVEHLLYPEKGLALTLNKDGKEALQYVAPHEFERLRDALAP